MIRYLSRIFLFCFGLGATDANSATISYLFEFDTASVVNLGFLEAAGISGPVYKLSATVYFESGASPYFYSEVSGEHQSAKYNFSDFILNINDHEFFSSNLSVLGDINVVDSNPLGSDPVTDSTVILNDADIATDWGFIDRIVISLFSTGKSAVSGSEIPSILELQQIAASALQSELYISGEAEGSTVLLVTPRVTNVTISELTAVVPAPSTGVLLISGLVGMFLMRRRKLMVLSSRDAPLRRAL